MARGRRSRSRGGGDRSARAPRGEQPCRQQRHGSTASGSEGAASGMPEDSAGLVCMKAALDLPPGAEAFDASDALADEAAAEQSTYAYRRHVRGSVMIRLGMAPTAAGEGLGHIEDVYAKTSDELAETMYMAMMLGLGTLDLSKGMARCGWVVGLFFFVCLSLVNLFLCHRLLELPHYFRLDIVSYGDIAKASLNSIGWKLVLVLITLSWFGTCSIYLTECLKAVDAVFGCGKRVIPPHYKIPLFVGLLPLIFKTNANSLRRASIVSLFSMLAIGCLEMLVAVFHGITDYAEDRSLVYVAIPFKAGSGGHGFLDIDFYRISNGLKCFVLSFTGIAALPYVISEMTMPQHAKVMTVSAWKKITLFQCAVAMLSYFGWGQRIASGSRDSLSEILTMSEDTRHEHRSVFFFISAVIMSLLMLLKTVASFPLCFWPLYRELLGAIQANEEATQTPALQLQLPWAVHRAQFVQTGLRVLMLVLTVSPAFLGDYSFFKTFMTCGPLSAVNFALPALFALLGILSHQNQSRASAWAAGPRSALAAVRRAAAGVCGAARGALLGGCGPRESLPAGRECATVEMVTRPRGGSGESDSSDVRSGGGRAATPRPPAWSDDQFLFLRSYRAHIATTAVLSVFSFCFTAWNVRLGIKRLSQGRDANYLDFVARANCTSWFG